MRHDIRQVVYLDFTSMYPSNFLIQNLWQFVIAKDIEYDVCTDEIQQFINTTTIEDFQNPDTWTKIQVLCANGAFYILLLECQIVEPSC